MVDFSRLLAPLQGERIEGGAESGLRAIIPNSVTAFCCDLDACKTSVEITFGNDAGRRPGRMWRDEIGVCLHGIPFPERDGFDSIGDPVQNQATHLC